MTVKFNTVQSEFVHQATSRLRDAHQASGGAKAANADEPLSEVSGHYADSFDGGATAWPPSWYRILSGILDVGGCFPVVGEAFDVFNVGLALATGNPFDAFCNAISLIPGLGDAMGKGAKYIKLAVETAAANGGKVPGYVVQMATKLQGLLSPQNVDALWAQLSKTDTMSKTDFDARINELRGLLQRASGGPTHRTKRPASELPKVKNDIPDRFLGEAPFTGEAPTEFAMRVLVEEQVGRAISGKRLNPNDLNAIQAFRTYTASNMPMGPGSEYSQLKKYAETHFH